MCSSPLWRYWIWNVWGAFKNKFDSDFWAADPCLKNLIIERIILDSVSLLDANLKVKLKGLNVGALNKSSKFLV